MPTAVPQWPHFALYAVGIALVIMLLQRIPVVGKVIRFAFSLGLLAFLIFQRQFVQSFMRAGIR